jgi:aldehyde dehydrogenase (NAD+)
LVFIINIIILGGYKNSGVGRENGEAGLKNYLETKTIIVKMSNDTLP